MLASSLTAETNVSKCNGAMSTRDSQVVQSIHLASARDADLTPGSGSSPEEGKSNPLQDSCLGNPMAREAWWATVHGLVKESDTTWGLKKNKLLLHY